MLLKLVKPEIRANSMYRWEKTFFAASGIAQAIQHCITAVEISSIL